MQPPPTNPYGIQLNNRPGSPTEKEQLYLLVHIERQRVAELRAQLAALNNTNASAVADARADAAAARAEADLAIAVAEGREAEARALIQGVNAIVAQRDAARDDRDQARADLRTVHAYALQCAADHRAVHTALAASANHTGPPSVNLTGAPLR